MREMTRAKMPGRDVRGPREEAPAAPTDVVMVIRGEYGEISFDFSGLLPSRSQSAEEVSPLAGPEIMD